MSGGVKSKLRSDVSSSAAPRSVSKAEAAKRLDKVALTQSIERLTQRFDAVKALNAELLKELLVLDSGILSGTQRMGASAADSKLFQDTVDAFLRKHQGAYDALETAAKETAKALATPLLDNALRAGTADGNALAAQVLHAQQMIANTSSAESALMWSERVLADREQQGGGKLYDAYAAVAADLPLTLRDTVIEPALPQVAGVYLERNENNPAKAADKLATQTTFTMAALRMTVLVTDAESMTKAARTSPVALERAGAAYRGASPLLRILRGPGNLYGMYASVLEIYEGRYINGVRHGSASAAILFTHLAGRASTVVNDPTASTWEKQVATKLLTGTSGEVVKRGLAVAPGVLGTAAGFSYLEHSNRPTSVGNNVSLVGDVAVMAGSASLLAANVVKEPTRALTLARLSLIGWYGAALVFGGELYEVGRDLKKRSDATSPDRPSEGLKQVLGLKKSILPGVD